jgi:hypothetical protein
MRSPEWPVVCCRALDQRSVLVTHSMQQIAQLLNERLENKNHGHLMDTLILLVQEGRN